MARLVINGVSVDTGAACLNHTPLSRFLRDRGQTGTKEGCAEGDCGACSVAVASIDNDGAPTWRSVTSCIAPLGLFVGREVVTAEGLQNDDGLHPVQATMVRHLGSQCGYCTPGFITSMFEGYERDDVTADDPQALADQLAGNLCRCTGYRPIRDAMCHALDIRDASDGHADTLVAIGCRKYTSKRAHHADTATTPPAVDVAGVDARFVRPHTLTELLAHKGEHKDKGVLIGGATELGVLLRKRALSMPLLIDTAAVSELQVLERDGDAWNVGGAVTLARLEAAWLGDDAMAPAVRMLRVFASRQVKNAATLAGNIVTASPIGDMAPVLLALGAHLELASARGSRSIPLDDFFMGYRKTALAPDEVVVRFVIQRPRAGARFRTFKVSKRRELDISIVSAAFLIEEGDDGVVSRARLAFGGVAATPMKALKAMSLLVGRTVDDARADVRAALEQTFQPLTDARAGAAYRRALISSLWDRFVDNVSDEAHDGPQAFTRGTPWLLEDDASRALVHDSGQGHVTGSARYVDDFPVTGHAKEVWPVQSHVACGTLEALDVGAALGMPGVRAIITAKDITGDNDVGAIRHDEPLLIDVGMSVSHEGQLIALVIADTLTQAQHAARAVKATIVERAPLLNVRDAVSSGNFHARLDGEPGPHTMVKGDVDTAMQQAKHRLKFSVDVGGQEHFYLETHAAYAEPGDEGDVTVYSSTQHPSEVQAVVSHVLHMPRHMITVVSPRMGGGFGGKETQGNGPAALVALAALKLKAPVRLMWDRDVDMKLTGKRHPFCGDVEVGFDDDGKITALIADIHADGGFALDLSESIHDRALFHMDNCYDLQNVRLTGRIARTNVVSHTAYRGFGGPQGMLYIEDTMTRIAQHLGLAGDVVRARNFYAPKNAKVHGTTPYGQVVDDFRVSTLWPALLQGSEYQARRDEIARFNATSTHVKRGIAVTPVKFGISFTASFLNQAGALVVMYRDGSVQVSHGGTEMGQGLMSKMLGVAMRELGVPRERVRVMHTRTDKVPNTSATAASSGADLNGAAVVAACQTLKARLAPIAAHLLEHKLGKPINESDVVFVDDEARAATRYGKGEGIALSALCEAAYLRQVSLSATGFYRTPDIGYDKKKGHGKPFHYFAYGAAVAEVELDGTTGMRKVRRVDIIHDVGDSLNPSIDRGQIEGAFVQGMGWLTGEELLWSKDGKLLSHSASTYQIPSFSDAPADFRVRLYQHITDDSAQPLVVHGSKAVGEPPFMLAFSVREALKHAIASFSNDARYVVDVPSPLTHEALFFAVARAKQR